MRKKRIIIIVVVGIVLVLLAGLFFLVKYDVMGKLYDVTFGHSHEKEVVEATDEPIIIENKMYKGEITKIEDNKIYFMVDEEGNIADEFMVEDVEDYEVVFDIDTLDLEVDSSDPYPLIDYLSFGKDLLYSAADLVDMIGKSLRVQNILIEDYYTGEEYRSIVFYLEEKI